MKMKVFDLTSIRINNNCSINQERNTKLIKKIILRKNTNRSLAQPKIKTLKLTLCIVVTFVMCTLPFYIAVFTVNMLPKTKEFPENIISRIISKFRIFYYDF